MTVDDFKAILTLVDNGLTKNKQIVTADFLTRIKAAVEKLQSINPNSICDMVKVMGIDLTVADIQAGIDGANLFIETEGKVIAGGMGDKVQTSVRKLLASPLEDAIIARFL